MILIGNSKIKLKRYRIDYIDYDFVNGILTYLSGHYNHFLVLASSSMLLQFDLFRYSVLQSFTLLLLNFLDLIRRHLSTFPWAFLLFSFHPLSIFKGTSSSSIRS